MSVASEPEQVGPAPDPSMDDILASIRRILDEEGTRAAGPADPAPAPGAAHDDVLELDQSMMLPEPDAAAPGPVPGPPPVLAEPVAAAEPQPPARLADLDHVPAPLPVPMPAAAPNAPAAPAPSPPPATLVAPAAAAAAASSVGALMRTLASGRTTATSRGGPTIEDLVREEIRPLLKEWLDTHLPPLVERLVRAEIERVVGRMG